jgi:hypothetical protein
MARNRYFLQLLLVLLIAFAFSLPSFGDTYQITFSGSGAPASVDFSYTAGIGFTSGFTVDWQGQAIPFTLSNLNTNPIDPNCAGTGTGATGFAAITNATGCTSQLYGWEGHYVPSVGYASFGLGPVDGSGNCSVDNCTEIGNVVLFPATEGSYLAQSGPITVTDITGAEDVAAAAEPGTFSLLFLGMLGLGLLAGVKHSPGKSFGS